MHTITSCLISSWLLLPCSSTTCSDITRQGLDPSPRDTHRFDACRISGMGMTQKCSLHARHLSHQSWRLAWWKRFLKSRYWESHVSPLRSSTTGGTQQQLFERGRGNYQEWIRREAEDFPVFWMTKIQCWLEQIGPGSGHVSILAWYIHNDQ